MAFPVTTKISSIPEAIASSTINWIVGLSTIGNISLAIAFVAGKNLVPKPAAGMTALRTFLIFHPPETILIVVKDISCIHFVFYIL